MVEALLDRGFPVDYDFDGYGNTPMHDASNRGRDEILRLLISRGGDINKANIHNYTPLIYASGLMS